MSRARVILLCIVSTLALAHSQLFQSRKLEGPVARGNQIQLINRADDSPFEDIEAEPDRRKQSRMCPVALTDSFDLIRAINNYRISHNLPSINISRSLMSTGCAHMRDVTSSAKIVNAKCGLHSWASCCYPSDHSNPNCMHRKALQVTTALKWNIYNVAAYELAYEWSGGKFSAVRAVDMFVENIDHRKFILQEDTWADFKWRAIGAAVGDKYAYIWFGTLSDPNGDFDQFHVEEHTMELPGCTCTGEPITWRPAPTLSPEEQAAKDAEMKLASEPMMYTVSEGPVEELELALSQPKPIVNATVAPEDPSLKVVNLTAEIISEDKPEGTTERSSDGGEAKSSDSIELESASSVSASSVSASSVSSSASDSGSASELSASKNELGLSKTIGVSLEDFLKGLTQQS